MFQNVMTIMVVASLVQETIVALVQFQGFIAS